ncbi:hypothetical protein [Acinetobacter sp. WCHAc060025]|uniref:hypothetical protein n=1 Tax=Acinetobacter sp. WCHAc060025 TaxID=2518625 RepID=UPI001022E513|nr:hypothetical protein [Acinetobacter sp. WCHAc060025]RZG77522.1 hypothetical protein EXE09_03765 [Acinetobacter sp. WCHAc060025]
MATLIINQNKNPEINQDEFDLNEYGQIHEMADWQGVLDIYLQLKKDVYPKKVFVVLDDVGQAMYTSMHATQNDDLYFDLEEQFKDVSENDFKQIEAQQGVHEVNYYVKQLLKDKNIIEIKDLKNCLKYDTDDFKVICQMNHAPLAVLESELRIKLVDVETEVLKFAVLPNGYFSCDLQPFESFAIIQLLEKFGFEFLGLGASLLGFVKTESFKIEKSTALIDELNQVYHFDLSTQNTLIQHIKTQNYLILTYTESPQEYADFYDV